MRTKLYIGCLVGSALLAGCGGGSESMGDITVNVAAPAAAEPTPASAANNYCSEVTQADFVSFNSSCTQGTVTGTIDTNYTFISEVEYILSGVVKVGNGNIAIESIAEYDAVVAAGADLTIEAGTNIKGAADGVLLVTRGSKLIADGSKFNPITFSSIDTNYDGMGEWGGVIIQGFAPQFGQGGTGACYTVGESWCNVLGEGGDFVQEYGGSLKADDSGIIRYVRIAEGGLIAGPNNEINGLTLQGVGHGTLIDYIQVHGNQDDGIEWFGGTVNVTHAVLTNNDDDDIDFDEGYQGNIQYALIIKNQTADAVPVGSNDPRGIELNSSDADYTPETAGVIANVTIIGGDAANSAGEYGMRLRGSVTASIINSAVTGYDATCARIDDSDTDGDAATSKLDTPITMQNFLCDTAGLAFSKEDPISTATVIEEGINFNANMAIENSSALLGSATAIVAQDNGSSFIFNQTNYIGAVDPSATAAWWADWTISNTVVAQESVQAASFVSCNTAKTECTVTGTIDTDYTMVSGVEYRLDGVVKVGNGNIAISSTAEYDAVVAAGVSLTVRAGVNIKAYDDGVLLVTRGSKLIANGSATNPITFSSLDVGFDGMGEWGGVIIQGFAPQYGQGGTGACFLTGETWCNVLGEGGDFVQEYGGSLKADDSGIIRYVRIAEGGLIAGPNNEINGLTLQGVGHGTVVDYIQVHGNQDDGIEWFGGTVNVTHALLTNNDDDDIDFDEGYQGNIQYALIIKNQTANAVPVGSNDPRGIELNSSDASYTPETAGVIANVTIIGGDAANSANEFGMRLRGSVTASIINSAVTGYDVTCARIDDSDTDGDAATAKLDTPITLQNFLCDTAGAAFNKELPLDQTSVILEAVVLDANKAITNASASVSATTIVAIDNGSDFQFDSTDFIGAVKPNTTPWYSLWAIPGSF